MKNKLLKASVLLLALTVVCSGMTAGAQAASYVPYTTYTYSYDGEAQESPNAFVPAERYDGTVFGTGELKNPSDLFVDTATGKVYIADTGNNRILIFNNQMKLIKVFAEFENTSNGGTDKFKGPQGVFVSSRGHVFVADTENGRIVEFDTQLKMISSITEPDSPFWPKNMSFKPISMVVDGGNRIYSISQNMNEGVVNLSENGDFLGFYGAQKVQQSIFDWFTQLFQNDEKRKRTVRTVPRVYNSISIDNRDFVWLTANSIEKQDQINYMTSKSSVSAPVKRLNPKGDDVLFRNAKWAPGGDLGEEPSSIVDVTMKDNGIYSILDSNKNKIFTYDNNGNLLYAFGASGQQLGTFNLCNSISYFGNELLVLDKGNGTVTRFEQTEYGALIERAIVADADREFEESLECWNLVLKQNQNFDMAYTGIAEAFLRNGDYKEAMDYFKTARDTENYSRAFKSYRSEFVRKNLIYIVLIACAVLAVLFIVNRKIKKFNNRIYSSDSRHTLLDEFLYAFYSMYHPMKGAWSIKAERRGSVRAAHVINLLVIATFIFKGIGTGYIFNNVLVQNFDLIRTALSVVLPIILWCVASWSLTTLCSGEGNIKQIYVTTSYSLMPLVVINIPMTIISNFLAIEEQAFLTFMVFLSFAWSLLLIFAATMTIHDYTMGKNLFTVILSVVGMLIILFLAILLITLSNKIGSFIQQIYEEIVNRL